MSLKTPDVVVAGAGIVGLSAACELSRRGLRCLVLDRGRVGREASHAAGGILSPQGEARPGSPLLPLALLGRDRHVRLADELLDLTGISVEHQKQGVLSIAFSAEEESALRELTSAQRGLGLRAEMMSREEVRRIEPSVHDETCAAALYPDDHRVNNRRLLDALRTLALARGVELREFTAVRSVETTEGRLVAVRTDGGRIETRSLVNALGAWAGQIDGLAEALSVRPVKGHMMALVDGPAVQHVLYGRHGYIVPRNDGRLIVGSTMEEAGFDARITVDGLARLFEIARAISPATGAAAVADTWTGFRPATSDGLPVIGHSRTEGVVIAGGLFRNGILLGPLVGELAAALVLGDTPTVDLSAFDPARFSER
jgi:glycine oxidase